VIKAIIFDCFGVLTTDTWNAFLDGLPEAVDIQAAREVHRQYDAGLITKIDCSEQIRAITGQVFTELEDMQTTSVKNEILLRYIANLKHDYSIGLLSNVGNNWIRDTFLTIEEQNLFDAMVFSFEVGTIKPDERMYVAMCEKLAIEPAKAIMIDDKTLYCDAARATGMQAICYKDFKSMKKQLEKLISHE
jgi:HAD superfamily hydrolase (TIGR01509 family)